MKQLDILGAVAHVNELLKQAYKARGKAVESQAYTDIFQSTGGLEHMAESCRIDCMVQQRVADLNLSSAETHLADIEKEIVRIDETYTSHVDISTVVPPAKSQSSMIAKSRRNNVDVASVVNRLKQRIANGYVFPGSYKKLQKEFGGCVGTWTNIFQADETLQDWKKDKSVPLQKQGHVDSAVYDDEFIPEDELEKHLAELVNSLPKKDQAKAIEEFASRSIEEKRDIVRVLI